MTKPSIKNEQEYAAALEAIERLLDAEPGTPEGEKFEALAKMIEEYDDINYPVKHCTISVH